MNSCLPLFVMELPGTRCKDCSQRSGKKPVTVDGARLTAVRKSLRSHFIEDSRTYAPEEIFYAFDDNRRCDKHEQPA